MGTLSQNVNQILIIEVTIIIVTGIRCIVQGIGIDNAQVYDLNMSLWEERASKDAVEILASITLCLFIIGLYMLFNCM